MRYHYIINNFPHNEKVEEYNKNISHRGVPFDEADMIVCGGGDGTLLKTINKYSDTKKIFWGYNAGTVGFLMNSVFPEESEDVTICTFKRIEVEVHEMIKPDFIEVKKFHAFNDICIGGDMNSWINFDIKEEDELFGVFNGGGLIISTPQGSTGINKNNGGSILPLSSHLWSVTGDKTNIPIDYVILPRKMEINMKSRSTVSVWVDGSNHIIHNVHKVVVREGDEVRVGFDRFNEFKKERRLACR